MIPVALTPTTFTSAFALAVTVPKAVVPSTPMGYTFAVPVAVAVPRAMVQ